MAEMVISATSEARSSQARDPTRCARPDRARRRVLDWAASLRSRRRLRGTGRVFMRPPGRLLRRVEDDCAAESKPARGDQDPPAEPPSPGHVLGRWAQSRCRDELGRPRHASFFPPVPAFGYLNPSAAAPWSARLEIGLANTP